MSTKWNQVATLVEQMPTEKQDAIATLVCAWVEGSPEYAKETLQPTGKRRAGSAAGQFVIPPEFDAPLPEELLAAFEGRL